MKLSTGNIRRNRNSPPLSAATRLGSRAWRIAGAYAIFATAWIYYSDQALSLVISDSELLLRWSVYKGIAFVALTSFLLLLLMIRAFSAIDSAYAGLNAHKKEIERSNRLYSALSHVNQAIVMSGSREELFKNVTQALVKDGLFQMVWFGWLEKPGDLKVVTAAGTGTEHIARLLALGSEQTESGGVWHQVFSADKTHVCNDLFVEPFALPLREQIRANSLLSYAALPIRMKSRVCGVMNIYASDRGFFRKQEITLLEEAAQDISFTLDRFALEQEHRLAENQALRESRFSEAIIESMPGVLYFYDQQGKFLRWNKNFEKVTGYSGSEIADMHPLQFFQEKDQQLLTERIGEVFSKGESSVEAPFVSKNGTITPYFFTGRSVLYHGEQCLVGVGIDISERKEAEDALRELNETLEHKVSARTTELEYAVARAESADRIKSAFLATMSHELRTPLNSIIGFTGIILQELAGPLNQEQSRQLNMVKGSANHLLALINDVLDLSKIEAGQLEVRHEEIDLPAVINNVVAAVSPLAEKKGLQIDILTPEVFPVIFSDRRRIEQILINLLNNAIKFTDEGEISLRLETVAARLPNDRDELVDAVSLEVTDSGIGIRKEDLDNLFQPFRQLDTGLSRQHEGTGLGLAICRRLAGLMGGRITADSEWGKGSIFKVTLPLSKRNMELS